MERNRVVIDEQPAGDVITLSCPNCDQVLVASPLDPDVACESCLRRVCCVECPHCTALLASVTLDDLECPECRGLMGVLSGPAPRTTLGGFALALAGGPVVIRDARVVDSAGWGPRPGTEVALEVSSCSFGFGPETYRGPTIWLPLSSLRDVWVNGAPLLGMDGSAGAWTGTQHAHALGGPTGDALDELAASDGKWVVLSIVGDHGFVTLRIDGVPADDIPHQLGSMREALSVHLPAEVPDTSDPHESTASPPAVERVVASRPESAWTELVSALERLALLYDRGALSAEEFSDAKGVLIRAAGGQS